MSFSRYAAFLCGGAAAGAVGIPAVVLDVAGVLRGADVVGGAVIGLATGGLLLAHRLYRQHQQTHRLG